MRTFNNSIARSFDHSIIKLFIHSIIGSFSHSMFVYSIIGSFHKSIIWSFDHANIRLFDHFIIWSNDHSIIGSIIWSFDRSLIIQSFDCSIIFWSFDHSILIIRSLTISSVRPYSTPQSSKSLLSIMHQGMNWSQRIMAFHRTRIHTLIFWWKTRARGKSYLSHIALRKPTSI